MTPEMRSVSSSSVAAVGYDEQAEELYVEFHGTGVYAYLRVQPFVFEDLLRSNSIGTFVNQVIKPAYECRRL